MTCPALPADDLVAWTDDELPPADAARVAAHVAACPACAREADLLRRTGALAARLPGLAPSAGFADRVVAASRAAAPRGRRLRFPARAAVAAAVVLVAVGGAWVALRPADPARLTAREEEEIARDLIVLAHLDTLRAADAEELAGLADDLDALDQLVAPTGDGG